VARQTERTCGSALWAICDLQLALRHPANVGASAPIVRDFAKQLLLKLVVEGVLTQDEADVAFRASDECRFLFCRAGRQGRSGVLEVRRAVLR
jgi:hypothetical protein